MMRFLLISCLALFVGASVAGVPRRESQSQTLTGGNCWTSRHCACTAGSAGCAAMPVTQAMSGPTRWPLPVVRASSRLARCNRDEQDAKSHDAERAV